ncbi:hypothetical protein [Micromonospora sp. NPDC047730]|uniref:hypothetical protein n=1 Tax=Micromonospora sp. NPDC047730 TaxID=3364253 RepID=UPI00371AD59A
MASVTVTVKNNSGQTVSLSMDENDERIAHFRKLVRREELAAVDVKPAKTPAKTPAAK